MLSDPKMAEGENNMENAEYVGFKIRFAKLYHWIDIRQEERIDYFNRICNFLSERINEIERAVGITFFGDTKRVIRDSGKYGSFLEFPNFSSSILKNPVNIEGNIRINPCIASVDENGRHSKIWVNANNTLKNTDTFDSQTIHRLLKLVRKSCKDIAEEVGRHYIEACDNLPEIETYWISIETVIMSEKSAQTKGIESLFIIGDKDRFMELFKDSTVAKQSMADVAKWLFDRDVTNPLKFVRETKSEDVDWKVMKSSRASVFYGQRNTDDFFHIVGVGKPETPQHDLAAIDSSFLPYVASLVAKI